MRRFALMMCVVFAATGCGPLEHSASPASDQFWGRWQGDAELYASGGFEAEIPMDLGVTVTDGVAYIDQVCPAWHSKLEAPLDGNVTAWSGILYCEPSRVGTCENMRIVYTGAVLSFLPDGTMYAAFEGYLYGCGMSNSRFLAATYTARDTH